MDEEYFTYDHDGYLDEDTRKIDQFAEACRKGNDKVVDILINDLVNKTNTVALGLGIILAIENNNKTIVENIIKHGFTNFVSIKIAIEKGYNDIFFMMLEYDMKTFSSFDIEDIFMIAIASGNLDIVSYIYISFPNLFSIPSNMFKSVYNLANQTVLSAGMNNHLHIIKYLLNNGIGKITDLTPVVSVLIKNDYFEEAKRIMDSDDKIKPTINKEFRKYLEKKKTEMIQAQKKIYYWWIHICYDPNRDVGKRMMERSWKKYCQLISS